MAKIKTQVNGQEVEVDLGDQYVSRDDLTKDYMPKAAFQEELTRRTGSIAEKKLDEALADDAFKQKALEKWGITPADPEKKAKETVNQIAEAQQKWEHQHLKPLKQKVESYEQEIGGLRSTLLHNQIMQAALDAGVKKSLLKSPAAGVPAPIVSMVGAAFGYDDKTKSFYVKNGDTFAFTGNPADANGSPYKGVGEFLKEWAADKVNADFIETTRQTGPNLSQQDGHRTAGSHVITREDARDPQKYRAAREAATKAGTQLQIVG